MAHWIVDDHGFGGTYYKCSECKETWNSIYSNVSTADENCPNCGAPMDEDDVEYVEKKNIFKRNFLPRPGTIDETLRKYEEMESELIKLTGCDVEKLVDLFAAGYTLEAPKNTSFEDLSKMAQR